MGEQKQEQNIITPPVSDEPKGGGLEELVLKINRATNELIFSDPRTGKETKIRASVIDEEPEPIIEPIKPLTVEEFSDVLGRLTSLGVTWSTDIPPIPIFKQGLERDDEFWKEYLELQNKFPGFPYELGKVIFHELLHTPSDKEIDKKAGLISGLLNQEYRSEFFFKYAIKVSYFEDIDWEVVVKAYEKGISRMPKVAYALLSLVLRNPVNTTLSLEDAANAPREPEFIAVAVNEKLIDKLISRLFEIKRALEQAQTASSFLTERGDPNESSGG